MTRFIHGLTTSTCVLCRGHHRPEDRSGYVYTVAPAGPVLPAPWNRKPTPYIEPTRQLHHVTDLAAIVKGCIALGYIDAAKTATMMLARASRGHGWQYRGNR